MKKACQWVAVALIWIFALGSAYIGIILLLLGPMMGPRGDIDYGDFTDAQKHAAEIQALLTQLLGLIPLAISALSFFYSVRIAKYIFRIPPDKPASLSTNSSN
jgi:hypothetical protein